MQFDKSFSENINDWMILGHFWTIGLIQFIFQKAWDLNSIFYRVLNGSQKFTSCPWTQINFLTSLAVCFCSLTVGLWQNGVKIVQVKPIFRKIWFLNIKSLKKSKKMNYFRALAIYLWGISVEIVQLWALMQPLAMQK